MKVYILILISLTMSLASCGNNTDKGNPEEKKTSDSLVSDSSASDSVISDSITSDSVTTDSVTSGSSVAGRPNVDTMRIEQMLNDYEKMIGTIRDKFYVDGKYQAPPGYKYHTEIHPVVEFYERLKSRQRSMTPEQLERFKSLTKKIREAF